MKLSGGEIANSGASKFTQAVTCRWCERTASIELGVQHQIDPNVTYHCSKCGRMSMIKVADKWFDQHTDRMNDLKDVWKKIPSEAYVTWRQALRSTPGFYTIYLGGSKRPEEFHSRDIIEHILTNEYGMSWNQANGILATAALTAGQKVYVQRWTRLLMAAQQREQMKRTGHGKETLIKTGTQVRVNGSEGLFLRYSQNDGFAIVALPVPGIDGFGDAEVPVMDLEVVDAGGPEVAEDFEFDKAMDEEGLEGEPVGLEQALEHVEEAEEIIEDLVLDEGGPEAIEEHAEHEEAEHEEEHELAEKDEGDEEKGDKEEGGNPFAASRKEAIIPPRPGGPLQQRPIQRRPGGPLQERPEEKLMNLQRIIQDPNTDPQTLQKAQMQWTQLKRQVPASRKSACEHKWVKDKNGEHCSKCDARFNSAVRTGVQVGPDEGKPNHEDDCKCDKCKDYRLRKNLSKNLKKGYKTKEDLEVSERPEHKTKGPKLTDTKLKGDSWVPDNEDKNPNPKKDKNLKEIKANKDAQRRVHTHYSNSGDLKRAINVNREELSIEDIRDLCKFYANTGKIAYHEADELAFWFIGDKPRLLSARDLTAGKGNCPQCGSPTCNQFSKCKKYQPGSKEGRDNRTDRDDEDDEESRRQDEDDEYYERRRQEDEGKEGRRVGALDPREVNRPPAGSMLDRNFGVKTCPNCGRNNPRNWPSCPCGKSQAGPARRQTMRPLARRGRGALSLRDLRISAKDAGEAEVPDAHPESGVSSGSGATSTPDPKRQSGESANSVTGPEKVKDHGSGKSPKESGDVKTPDLGLPKGALSKRDAAAHKPGCGCGFCSRMKENSEWSKSRGKEKKDALSARDIKKTANVGVGVFMPATHNGSQVLVVAFDNTGLRATVQDGAGNQHQVDVADLEPVKTGPYSGMSRD